MCIFTPDLGGSTRKQVSSVVSPGRRHWANHRAQFRSVRYVATQPLHNQRSPGEVSFLPQTGVCFRTLSLSNQADRTPTLAPGASRAGHQLSVLPFERLLRRNVKGTNWCLLLVYGLCSHARLVWRTRAGATMCSDYKRAELHQTLTTPSIAMIHLVGCFVTNPQDIVSIGRICSFSLPIHLLE